MFLLQTGAATSEAKGLLLSVFVWAAAKTDVENGAVLLSITRTDGPSYHIRSLPETPSQPTAGHILTTKQLIVHRGLAVAAAVAVLAVGVMIRFFTITD